MSHELNDQGYAEGQQRRQLKGYRNGYGCEKVMTKDGSGIILIAEIQAKTHTKENYIRLGSIPSQVLS